MVLIGLLLIALICLALGLVLPSAAWLIASLIASGGAGYLLIRARQSIGAGAAKPARARRAAGARSSTGPAPRSAAGGSAAGGSAAGGSAAGGAADAVAPGSGDDGGPDSGLDGATAAAEATEQEPAAPPSAAAADEVWVIDGRPRYHLADCAIIQGQDAEPIPFEQATEDGFMACSLCEPNVLRSAS